MSSHISIALIRVDIDMQLSGTFRRKNVVMLLAESQFAREILGQSSF